MLKIEKADNNSSKCYDSNSYYSNEDSIVFETKEI